MSAQVTGLGPAGLRTGRATIAFVAGNAPDGEYFVNKWTRKVEHYAPAHLALPDRLNVRGALPPPEALVIGIGGTRSPAAETFALVARLVRLLVEESAWIVSGAVPGVDLAAHLAALGARRPATMAVLANPVELGFGAHEWASPVLDALLVEKGCFLSEYDSPAAIGGATYRRRLLERDRVISGLCDIFVAFECSRHSATVDTGIRAQLQGKGVVAVHSKAGTWRDGLFDLESRNGVSVFHEKLHSDDEMAGNILELARRRHAAAA